MYRMRTLPSVTGLLRLQTFSMLPDRSLEFIRLSSGVERVFGEVLSSRSMELMYFPHL